jgi:small-conductance mechanosensitive channel
LVVEEGNAMPWPKQSRYGCLLVVVVTLSTALRVLSPAPDLALAQEGPKTGPAAVLASGSKGTGAEAEPDTSEDTEGISFPAEDMEEGLRKAAAEVGEQARSLLVRRPLGFDLGTIERLRDRAVRLPLEIPDLIQHVLEQSRLLGFVGSLIMLAFLAAVFYSLFGQKKVLERLEKSVEPLRPHLPELFYPYFLSLMRIVVASLIPLLLFGAYSLIRAFISYSAPWFQITGNLLMLWALGALLINLLREALTREILPIEPSHGRTFFRVARVVLLYILFSFAVFLSAEALQIPDDFLALLRFVLSLSIVLASLLLLLKKRAILGVLPELPYKGYQVFVRGLTRFYFPAIFLTFLTGILWCFGYHDLCLALWRMTWAVVGAFVGIMVVYHLLNGRLRQWALSRPDTDDATQALYRALRSLLLYATVITLLLVTLELLGLAGPIQRILSFPVLKVGGTPLSLWTILKAALFLLAFFVLSRLVRAWLDYRVYPAVGVEEGLAYAINTFLHYTLLTVGFLVALRAVGLDLRVLMVFAGALGIGIGLGMQSTAANLISGFSIVFGRRIRKGDWIQVGDTLGNVQEVGLRATKVRTRDNIEYLIPNADLTANTIVNYTLSDPLIRIHVPVGVSYKSDPKKVEAILLKAAEESERVNRTKKPEVWFTEYADSSLNFDLLVWIDVRAVTENKVRSDLYYTIFQGLAEAGIEIPFPQRDLHIRSGLFTPESESND